MNKNSNKVYSTQTGSLCPRCGSAKNACSCRAIHANKVVGDGKVRVSRESKGRKGKGVTLISGLALNETELKNLARQLKQLCGSGGSVKHGVIEIQGEHREKLVTELCRLGHKALQTGA